MDRDYTLRKESQLDLYERIYPDITNAEYFTTLAAQKLLTEQNQQMMKLRVLNTELLQQNLEQESKLCGYEYELENLRAKPETSGLFYDRIKNPVDPATKEKIYKELKLANLEGALADIKGVTKD